MGLRQLKIFVLLTSLCMITIQCGNMTSAEQEKITAATEQNQATTDFQSSAAAWFYNGYHRKSIATKAFGPSPQSIDGRTIFNLNASGNIVKNGMWHNLRTKFNAIYLHILLLDNIGLYQKKYAARVALNNGQFDGLRKIQRNYKFKVIVDAGISLGQDCNQSSLSIKAENAALKEMLLYDRLIDRGIIINEVSVDGPFLRVIRGSGKALSCASRGQGYSRADSVKVISMYLSRLQRKISQAQGVVPKMNIVLNLPNWRVGTQAGNFNVELLSVLAAFRSQPEYPGINEIVLDYPYGFIAANPNLFKNKLLQINQPIIDLRGNTKISFFTNTIGSFKKVTGYSLGHTCLNAGNTLPYLLLYENNRCLSRSIYGGQPQYLANAQALIAAHNKKYVIDTQKYYNLVHKGLPSHIQVGAVYFATWSEFPSRMDVFAAKSVNIINLSP